MQDPFLVGRRQSGAQLPRYLCRLVLREPADPSQQRGQVFTVDILHREVVLTFHLTDIVNPADVRMGDFQGCPDFV